MQRIPKHESAVWNNTEFRAYGAESIHALKFYFLPHFHLNFFRLKGRCTNKFVGWHKWNIKPPFSSPARPRRLARNPTPAKALAKLIKILIRIEVPENNIVCVELRTSGFRASEEPRKFSKWTSVIHFSQRVYHSNSIPQNCSSVRPLNHNAHLEAWALSDSLRRNGKRWFIKCYWKTLKKHKAASRRS